MRISDWSSDVCSSDLAFASVDLNLTDQFIVSAEGRYTWEDKQIDNSFLSAAPGGVGSGLEQAHIKYFTPRVILQYPPTSDPSLSLSPAKGPNADGNNAGVSALATPAHPHSQTESVAGSRGGKESVRKYKSM